MDLWQYNAWLEAYNLKETDRLATAVHAAFYGAYWGVDSKHRKKSLSEVIKGLYAPHDSRKKTKTDFKAVAESFRRFEELSKYGWTKENK